MCPLVCLLPNPGLGAGARGSRRELFSGKQLRLEAGKRKGEEREAATQTVLLDPTERTDTKASGGSARALLRETEGKRNE